MIRNDDFREEVMFHFKNTAITKSKFIKTDAIAGETGFA